MFKSVKEYDSAVYAVLSSIKDEKSDWDKVGALSKTDTEDIIEFIVQAGLVAGLHVTRSANDTLHWDSQKGPRITRNGLNFVEQFTAQS